MNYMPVEVDGCLFCIDVLKYRYYPGLHGSYFDPPEPASVEVSDIDIEYLITKSRLKIDAEWLDNHDWYDNVKKMVLEYLPWDDKFLDNLIEVVEREIYERD